MGIRYAIPLVFLLYAPAQAMDYSHFRRSGDIDDRRADDGSNTADSMQFPESEILQLTRYGEVARQGKMPFLCPALRGVQSDASALGQKLAKVKTPFTLKLEYKAAAIAATSKGSATSDSCEGSKLSMMALMDSNIGLAQSSVANAADAHQETKALAKKVFTAIAVKDAHPSVGDQINNKISQCPKYVLDYKKAIANYLMQLSKLSIFYSEGIENFQEERESISRIHCSSITPGAGVSTSRSQSSTITGGLSDPQLSP